MSHHGSDVNATIKVDSLTVKINTADGQCVIDINNTKDFSYEGPLPSITKLLSVLCGKFGEEEMAQIREEIKKDLCVALSGGSGDGAGGGKENERCTTPDGSGPPNSDQSDQNSQVESANK